MRRRTDRLDERILHQRASYWATRLAPRFRARERARRQLHYQWSVVQIEFARDVIFKRRDEGFPVLRSFYKSSHRTVDWAVWRRWGRAE